MVTLAASGRRNVLSAPTIAALLDVYDRLERDFVTGLLGSVRAADRLSSQDVAVMQERYLQRRSVTRPDFRAGIRAARERAERAGRRLP